MSGAGRSGGQRGGRRYTGRSLGIDAPGPAELAAMVERGFRFSRLEAFQRATGLPLEQLGRLAGIAPRTLTRRQAAGRLRPDESDRVLRLSSLFDLAVELFEGDTEEAMRWLGTPQRGLAGRIPLEFASTEIGAREVENLILRLEHGVVA